MLQQQHHASQFKESWGDLGMRVDLENAATPAYADADADTEGGVEEDGAKRAGGRGKQSIFRLHPPVKGGDVERLYWKRGVVGVGIGVLVVVVVAVVVGVGLYGRR